MEEDDRCRGEKRPGSTSSRQTKRWNNTKMTMHARTGGSSADRLVGNAEQDQNGHAFQTGADISVGAHDDWITQEKLLPEFDGAMRFPYHMRQTSKLSVFSYYMLLSVSSVYDTEWAHRNRPCSNKTLTRLGSVRKECLSQRPAVAMSTRSVVLLAGKTGS